MSNKIASVPKMKCCGKGWRECTCKKAIDTPETIEQAVYSLNLRVLELVVKINSLEKKVETLQKIVQK